jgi:serine/threonine protein kinase
MLSNEISQRPNSEKLLRDRDFWAIRFRDIMGKISYKTVEEVFFDFKIENDNIIASFLYKKCRENKFIGLKTLIQDIKMNGKFKENFNELEIIGSGASSIVCEAMSKHDNKLFAIKRIPADWRQMKEIFKEINFMKEIDNKFVVDFIDAWIEDNYLAKLERNSTKISLGHSVFDPYKPYLAHIQMQLCFKDLDYIIEIIKPNSILNYFVLSQLSIEIMEAIDHLHKKIPLIIHRDLKP